MLRLFRSQTPRVEVRAEPQAYLDVAHGGESYRIAIKRVAHARRFTLRVRAATLDAVLTMPTHGTMRAARTFAERHAGWVGDSLQTLPRKIPFAIGSVIPVRGEDIPILPSAGLRSAAFLDHGVRPDGSVGLALRVSGSPAEQHRRVLAFLQAQARRDLDAAVTKHAAAVGRPMRTISLRDTRSRWGSCSSRGALNFSWRLIMAPPHVLDYLAAHEVAHLVHLDHSPAYWAVARRLAPELDRAEAWLRAHGASLHRFGAAPSAAGPALLSAA